MKILLIDDEPVANYILIRLLKLINSEYEIVDYTEPEKAVADLTAIAPDLIFLDLNMPKLNGWGVLDAMTAQNSQVKVIILTSSVSRIDHEKAQGYRNVKACIAKPVTKDQLRACINAHS